MVATSYPTTAPASRHIITRSEAVAFEQSPYTIGDLTARRIVWHRAMLKAREYAPKLRWTWGDNPGDPHRYHVNSTRQPDIWYEVKPGFRCTCPAGENGIPCYHVARLASWLESIGCLHTCSRCGRREAPHGGHWRHVGGQPDAWLCTHCLTEAC